MILLTILVLGVLFVLGYKIWIRKEQKRKKSHAPICTAGWPVRIRNGQKEILLGTKAPTEKALKRGIALKLLPYGGDLEASDTDIVHGFVRELMEESGDAESRLFVSSKDVDVVGRIEVTNVERPPIVLYLLLAYYCKGTAKTTREILDPRWYPASPLPDNILPLDKLILPRLLAGEKIEGTVLYSADMTTILDHHLRKVESIK